jgi:flagellar biosynthesis/type III secretory pathway protein FliH
LEFRFTVIQLNRLHWRDYLQHDNPAAAALMAKMGFAPEERVEVKKECLRMIARLKYEPEKTRLLSRFVDTYLRLNAEEQIRFKAALEKLPRRERKATMEILTSWEEKGIVIGEQRGIKQGLQQGLQHERGLVLRQLARRVGALSQRAQSSVARLSFEQLEQLGEALLDFNHPRDLTQWLREHAATNGKTNGKRTKK